MRHFCASAYVVDPRTKKILLVKHKDFKKWVQPGGHIMPDETPEEAAQREVYEETQVKIKLIGERFPRESDYIKPLGIQRNYSTIPGDTHIDILYAAVPLDTLVTVDYSESTSAGWFSREEIDHMDIFSDIKITFDYILKNIIR